MALGLAAAELAALSLCVAAPPDHQPGGLVERRLAAAAAGSERWLGWGEAAAPLQAADPSLAAARCGAPPALAREELEQQRAAASTAGCAVVRPWRSLMAQVGLAARPALGPAAAGRGCGPGGIWSACSPATAFGIAADLQVEGGSSAGRTGARSIGSAAAAAARRRSSTAGRQWRLDLATAHRWADRLAEDPRLQWLEQPFGAP